MENIKNLITRLGPTGGLVLIGFIVLIYIGLGFFWWQQGSSQKQLEDQIVKLSAIIARPLSSPEELQAKYDECNRILAPMPASDAIALLVSIAEQSGIDTSNDFRVPSAIYGKATVGASTYQTMSFRNIQVQGDYDDVMTFISTLDSGSALETMALKKVTTSWIAVSVSGEESARRAELRNVQSAVETMMIDNYLIAQGIPHPMSYAGGTATNLMGDDPTTAGMVEGFPDITTTAAEKGYTGTGNPRNGYVLNRHDKISENDSTQYTTVNYFSTLITTYYYTCEADGTVRQFDGPTVATATEYLGSEATKTEFRANVDVEIYTKSQ